MDFPKHFKIADFRALVDKNNPVEKEPEVHPESLLHTKAWLKNLVYIEKDATQKMHDEWDTIPNSVINLLIEHQAYLLTVSNPYVRFVGFSRTEKMVKKVPTYLSKTAIHLACLLKTNFKFSQATLVSVK